MAVASTSALASGTRTNSTVTAPSGITNGDILAYGLIIGGASGGVTATGPTGFTLATGLPVSFTWPGVDTYAVRLYLWTKKASGEAGNYTATHSSADTTAFMWRCSGRDQTTWVDQNPTTQVADGGGSAGNVLTAPSQTPTVNGCDLLWLGATWDGFGAATPTTGWSERRNVATEGFYVQDFNQVTAAATGGVAVTSTQGSNRPKGCVMLCLRAATGGGGQTIAAGLSSETDSAQTHTRRKSKAVGLNSETDSSLATTSRKTKAIGLNAETDTALALTAVKSLTLGLASETDSALAVTNNPIRRLLSQASETDSALALTARKSLAIGLASETDTAQAHSSRKTLAIGLASETDSALGMTGGVTIAIGLVTETDTALAATAAKQKAVGLSSETDSALALTARKTLAAGLASETDSALAATSLKTRTLGLSTENDSSLAATSSKSKAIGLASDSESALAATVVRSRTIGIAAETDTAFGLAVRKALEIGLAVEADTAITLGTEPTAPAGACTIRRTLGAVRISRSGPGGITIERSGPGSVTIEEV